MWRYEHDGILYQVDRQKAVVLKNTNNKKTEIFIPEMIQGKPITQISSKAFLASNVSEITYPDTIILIGESAFADCKNLKSVKSYHADEKKAIDETFILIHDFAFRGCECLEVVEIEQKINYVGIGAFAGCSSFKNLNAKIQKIRKDAFCGCSSLKYLILSDGAVLYSGCIDNSGIKQISVWGKLSIPKTIVNYFKKHNIKICCNPYSNAAELAYSGINVSFLW